MYQKILLCYDGTVEGRRALRQGADVAMAMQAHAYLLAICRDMVSSAVPEGVTPELVSCEQETAQSLLNEGVQWLRDHDVPAEGMLVYGDPLVHIPKIAGQIGADLIVVGYRYRSRFQKWWSEAEETRLLDRISCSILVAMAPPPA
ncbi:MAG TPA: universal stress protein [Steroidobacteraceae bacterium]|nr:universal stress protein [Steroidobacteraceae bacterium]